MANMLQLLMLIIKIKRHGIATISNRKSIYIVWIVRICKAWYELSPVYGGKLVL